MAFDHASWEAAVRDAAISRNEGRLKSLFDEGRTELGARVGHEWARILSALDAGAITG